LLRLTAGARPILSGRELRVTSPASGLLAERLLDAGMANPVVSSVPEPPDAAYAFVVPVRDRPRELDRLLTSIGTGHPVIVVDDASQRPEAVEAVAVTHGVKFLPLATNVGPAGARNAGLRLVTTPYVVFVDSDVVLTPDTVTTLLKHFTDPKVAMAVPRITALSTSNSTNWLGHYENARSSLDLDAHPVAVRPGTPVSWAPTVCAVARTDALRHGFGERMRVGEDVDLCWRLIESAACGTGAHPLAERHPVHRPCRTSSLEHRAHPHSARPTPLVAARRRSPLRDHGRQDRPQTLRYRGPVPPGAAAHGSRRRRRTVPGLRSDDPPLVAAHRGRPHRIAPYPQSDRGGCLDRHSARIPPRPRPLDPIRYGIARRRDDLAYGAGVWLSAFKGRSTAAPRPRIVRTDDDRKSAR
jgi:hypothetical protein